MKNIIRVLAGDSRGITQIETLGPVPDEARVYIATLLGKSFLVHYETSIKNKNLSNEWQKLRRKAQLSYFFRYPIKFIKNFNTSLMRRCIGSRIGHVTTIAIVGPDGVGKSTTIDKAVHYLSDAFITVQPKHWRPKLLPNISDIKLTKIIKPTSSIKSIEELPNAPRRSVGAFGLLRLLYYYTDYLLGHFVKDRLYLTPDILVNLYDRCALDMFIDPLRYGLNYNKLTFWIYRLSPKPDHIIFLSDAPERIFARKPELPCDEIAQQIEKWSLLSKKGIVNDIIYIGERNVEEIGRDIAKIILKQTSVMQNCGGTFDVPFVDHLIKRFK